MNKTAHSFPKKKISGENLILFKLISGLIELNENMTKDKNRQNKITKFEVFKV